MFTLSPPTPPAVAFVSYPFPQSTSRIPPSLPALSVPTNLRRPSSPPRSLVCRLHAALSSKPPDTEPEPPPPEDDQRGTATNLSRFRDRVQIFFAVLFWMSLFFWASAWDGRNRGGGRPNKGSPFRR